LKNQEEIRFPSNIENEIRREEKNCNNYLWEKSKKTDAILPHKIDPPIFPSFG